jgi:hypothetical protein
VRKGNRWRVFENKILWRIFGHKREEKAGENFIIWSFVIILDQGEGVGQNICHA